MSPVPYFFATEGQQSPSDFAQMQSAFAMLAQKFYDRQQALSGRSIRGFIGKTAGTGIGTGQVGTGRSAQATLGRAGGQPAAANAIKSIATRVGKFGNTKLKSSTTDAFRAKGFRVGAAPELPERTGKNKKPT